MNHTHPPYTLAHIVNPVTVGPESDLYRAQPITFDTMVMAQAFARSTPSVTLHAACFPEDQQGFPPAFLPTRHLERSVLDVGSFHKPRKLPLLKDILDRLYETSIADFFIYSNVDIAVMPFFYRALSFFIEQGLDAFIINRRTISASWSSALDIPLMMAQMGDSHPGHDCFVFKRDLYQNFELDNVCIGAKRVARALMANMIAFSSSFHEFADKHLTFQLGVERSCDHPDANEYYYHNVSALMQVFRKLAATCPLERRIQVRAFVLFNLKQICDQHEQYPCKAHLDSLCDIESLWLP